MNWTIVQIVVTVLVALAGFAVTVMLWLLGRHSKGLGFEVLSITRLIEKKIKSAERLEVRFDGNIIEDPHLVRVRVCNAQRGTISKNDFRKPIVITFGSAEVLPFSEASCKPQTLAPEIQWDVEHQVSVQPLDLNRGAEIVISALASKKISADHIECHTLIYDAVNRGDARLLKTGPPPALAWLGMAFMWVTVVGMLGVFVTITVITIVHAVRTSTYERVWQASSVLAAVLGSTALIQLVQRISDRKSWPDYMR